MVFVVLLLSTKPCLQMQAITAYFCLVYFTYCFSQSVDRLSSLWMRSYEKTAGGENPMMQPHACVDTSPGIIVLAGYQPYLPDLLDFVIGLRLLSLAGGR